ncbi:hypothetical protein ACUOFC_41710, partial [Escherichia sp. TWPC-MK]
MFAAAVAGIVLLASNAQAQTVPEGYQLQQVLMMSRHNLRAPLANNGSVLEQSTPNKWPEWDVPGGQLTTKGGVLEVYMGHLFGVDCSSTLPLFASGARKLWRL